MSEQHSKDEEVHGNVEHLCCLNECPLALLAEVGFIIEYKIVVDWHTHVHEPEGKHAVTSFLVDGMDDYQTDKSLEVRQDISND